jgi:two-component system, sensor histidine kinase PdtaS
MRRWRWIWVGLILLLFGLADAVEYFSLLPLGFGIVGQFLTTFLAVGMAGVLTGRIFGAIEAQQQEIAALLERERFRSGQLALAMRETHHRIKNNLQMISVFLSLELTGLPEGPSRRALQQSIDRVSAIGLVHDVLSHEQDLRLIDVSDLLERLMKLLVTAGGAEQLSIDVSADPLLLPSRTVTGLALVANELATNALEHGLGLVWGSPEGRGTADAGGGAPSPDAGAAGGEQRSSAGASGHAGSGGRLALSLRQVGEEVVMQVDDDGAGLPPNFDLDRDSGVGLGICRTLASKHLGGTLTLRPLNGGGTRAELRFPRPAAAAECCEAAQGAVGTRK